MAWVSEEGHMWDEENPELVDVPDEVGDKINAVIVYLAGQSVLRSYVETRGYLNRDGDGFHAGHGMELAVLLADLGWRVVSISEYVFDGVYVATFEHADHAFKATCSWAPDVPRDQRGVSIPGEEVGSDE